jgi:large subunit ribosomal protein L17
MRHLRHHRRLNRTSEHALALRRNMAQSLIEHGRIRTTLPKAKNLRPYVERLVTLAISSRRCSENGDAPGSLRARRAIHKLLSDRSLVPKEHQDAYNGMSDAARLKTLRMASGRRHRTGEPKGRLAFTGESVTHRLIERVAPRFADRAGGYTRIIRLPDRRLGDHAPEAILEFIGSEQPPSTLTKPEKTARRRRADARYALVVKLSKGKRPSRSREGTGAAVATAETPAESPPATEPQDHSTEAGS